MSDYLALLTQAQERNREVLINALRGQGITQATVEYSGAGDSGDTCDLAVEPAEALPVLATLQIRQHMVDIKNLGYRQNAYMLREVEVALDEAVRDFAMRWVDSLHGGWENNEGANGTVTFNVTEDVIQLEHTAYFTESASYEHTL